MFQIMLEERWGGTMSAPVQILALIKQLYPMKKFFGERMSLAY